MYVLWMLVALVWVSSPALVMQGEAASPDIAFPLYKMHDVAYVVLAFRDFPKLHENWFALPWQALQQSKGLGTFIVAVDAKELDEAPGFDRDRWPTQAQPLGGAGK